MTEEEWLKSDNLFEVLAHRPRLHSDRKLRLLAAASCRRLGNSLLSARYRKLIDVVERFADGEGPEPKAFRSLFPQPRSMGVEERSARVAARHAVVAMNWTNDPDFVRLWTDFLHGATESEWSSEQYAEHFTWKTTGGVTHTIAHDAAGSPVQQYVAGSPVSPAGRVAIKRYSEVLRSESRISIAYFRDILGNPFRPVAFDPSWQSSTTVALAAAMYESRDFGAMPVLADALEEAGCDNADVLAHCRDAAGVHVRGCWVVDLVLGKS